MIGLNLYPVDDKYLEITEKKLNLEPLDEQDEIFYNDYYQNIEKKAINDAAIIKNLEAERDAIENAIASLKDKVFRLDNKIERVEYDLKKMLDINEIRKIKTPYYDISICLNSPGANILNEDEIPMEYIKQSVVQKIDKALILKELKAGVIIPGAELRQDTRLKIK